MQSFSARCASSVLARLAATLAFAAAGLVPLAASAVPVTLPTGLNPGEQYRLAFVTSATRDATSTNIADYNSFVTNVANTVPELVALGTTWTVIGSTHTVAAYNNTATNPGVDGPGVPTYLLNDTVLADDYADLWDGSIDNPINVTESGTSVLAIPTWTGTNSNGTSATNALGTSTVAIYGVTDQSSSGWVFFGQVPSVNPRPLYAISGTLTAVPEPNAAALLALGLTALGVARRRS